MSKLTNNNAKGSKYKAGYYALATMGLALAIFSLLTDQMATVFALTSMIFAFSFGEMTAHYLFSKNKSFLIGAIFFASLSLFQTYNFVVTVL